MDHSDLERQLESLRATLEGMRRQLAETPGLAPEVAAATLAPLQGQVAALEAELKGGGALAQGAEARAAGERGVLVEGAWAATW